MSLWWLQCLCARWMRVFFLQSAWAKPLAFGYFSTAEARCMEPLYVARIAAAAYHFSRFTRSAVAPKFKLLLPLLWIRFHGHCGVRFIGSDSGCTLLSVPLSQHFWKNSQFYKLFTFTKCIHNEVVVRQNSLYYQLFLSPYNKITVLNRTKLYLGLDLVVIWMLDIQMKVAVIFL